MSVEKFSTGRNESKLSRQEIGERLFKLRQSGFFDSKTPQCSLIEEDATCKVVAQYLEDGNIQPALAFFDNNNPGPEVEAQFNGIGGRRAFRKILEIIDVPIPDVLKGGD